jgi:ComF family protein
MVIYSMLQDFLQGVRELIFPDNCLLCRQFLNSRHQRQLCKACMELLEFNNGKNICDDTKNHYAFDQAWAAILYNETAQKLLHAFKYSSKTSLHRTFVPLMITFVDRHQIPIQSFDMITPVPLYPARLRERGYNQSSLLSGGLSRHFGIMHKEDLLIRRKNTSTQTELGAKQRWTNLEGAFKINNSVPVTGKSVLIIDDLFTTGATLHWAADALKTAGAVRVGVLTLGLTT